MNYKEKTKAYDEALERARKLQETCDSQAIIGWMEYIFPELKESEDEKIRQWIIDDINYNISNEPLNNSEYRKKAEKAIAWLEKQGEQKPSWNEDDSIRLQRIIDFLWHNRKGDTDGIYQQEQDIKWLKSLKDKWEDKI